MDQDYDIDAVGAFVCVNGEWIPPTLNCNTATNDLPSTLPTPGVTDCSGGEVGNFMRDNVCARTLFCCAPSVL